MHAVSGTVTGVLRDARPPRPVLALLNPLMKLLLRSPVGRRIGGLALLTYTGRRSGRRRSVVVGWHQLTGGPAVFTPAGWRRNFRDGACAQVRHRGRTRQLVGILIDSPEETAAAINAVLAAGTSPRALGLRLSTDRPVTPAEVAAVHRAMIRFRDAA